MSDAFSLEPQLPVRPPPRQAAPTIAAQFNVISTPFGDGLTRRDAATYLKKSCGFGSVGLLAKGAMKKSSNGPRFLQGSATRSIYLISDLDAWVLAKLGEARTSHKTEAE